MTTTAISLPCPNGCTRTVAAHGKDIHYCVIKEFGQTHREYLGCYDGEIITRANNNSDAENALNDYVLLLCEQGLIDAPLAALADQAPRLPNGWMRMPEGDILDTNGMRVSLADSAVRTHLTYGHLRRDLFAPTYFCACGAQATIVVYGDPDVMRCDHCHAAPEPAYHAPGHCRNCGGAHHVQRCPEIHAALAMGWRAVTKRDLMDDGMSAAKADQAIRDLAALPLA